MKENNNAGKRERMVSISSGYLALPLPQHPSEQKKMADDFERLFVNVMSPLWSMWSLRRRTTDESAASELSLNCKTLTQAKKSSIEPANLSLLLPPPFQAKQIDKALFFTYITMFSGAGNMLVRRGLRQACANNIRHVAPSNTSNPSSAVGGVLRQAIRSLFIQTESTPNPESIKFIPGRPVLDGVDEGGEAGAAGFFATRQDRDEVARSPLAKAVFEVDGIKSIYLGPDFLTVTKTAESHWEHIRTPVFAAIMDFYASGKPVLSAVAEVTDTTIFDDDSEVVALIKEILEARIRPAVQEDGGDIRYVGFDESSGIVTVKLAGSCVGCPSSSVTLKNGVENMLMHYIEEVTGVEAQEEEGEEGDNASGGEGESTEQKKMKSYEERLAAAGIPFSD